MGRMETMLKPFEDAKEWAQPRIDAGIEQYRKADNCIEVVDEQGKPVGNVHIQYKLKRHSFWHGANCFMLDELETPEKNERYKELFAEAFNQATLPFYWNDLEPVQGKPRFAKDSPKIYRRPAPDLCMEYCDANGIIPKLHCLNYDQWSPVWLPMHDISEVKRQLERRIREIAERYGDRIHCMEVINETLCGFKNLDNRHSTDFFWEDDLISWSFETARRYLPKNELVINEATLEAWDIKRGYVASIADAIRRGAEIDAIGMQYHMFYKKEEETKRVLPYYSPKALFDTMDYYYNHFHVPLQVTEVTIPAYSNSDEDEELQARIIENLYSIWFSHPAMEAVTYWNLVDGYAAFGPKGDMSNGENYFYGGLVRFDFTPKPAYYALRDLFKQRWHTEGSIKTDDNGCACFRGFKGDYEIVLEKDNGTLDYTCKLEGGNTKLVIK